AEDGIREFHVTGVQTCALPICLAERLHVVVGALDDALLLGLLVEREGVAAGDGVGHEVWRSKVEGRRSSARGPPTSRPVDLRLEIGRASCRGRVVHWRGAAAL